MQREEILKKLREQGCRITKQRQLLLDIILQEEYSCCKEIYYKAAKQDSSIGIATVYRMINTLEDIGAISRNTMYRIDCGDDCLAKDNCEVKLNDGTSLELDTGTVESGDCQWIKGLRFPELISTNWME